MIRNNLRNSTNIPKNTARPPEGPGSLTSTKNRRAQVAAPHRGWNPPRSGCIKANRPAISGQLPGRSGLTCSRIAAQSGNLGRSEVRLQTSGDLVAPVAVAPRGGCRGILPLAIIFAEGAVNSIEVNLIMTINKNKLVRIYLVAVDLMAMALSFIIAASVVISEVDGMPFIQLFSIRISILNIIILMGFTLIWYIVLDVSGVYYVRRLNK
jgi:hypothetical protein